MCANILLLVKLLPNGFSIHGCLNELVLALQNGGVFNFIVPSIFINCHCTIRA